MLMFCRYAIWLALFLAVHAAKHPAARAEQVVDLELVLAVDVSWSMDMVEQALQREGYVAAFRNSQVQRAIVSGGHGRIAVAYVEWAGESIQQTVVDWTLIDSRATAIAFADALTAAPISRRRMTSISGALRYGASLFANSGFTGARRVIDISGDGPNNSGANVASVRDQVVASGVSINGLPVMLRPGRSGFFDISRLDEYYSQCVIGGPGAFVIAIRGRADFGPSIRRKLILEISQATPLAPRVIRTQDAGQSNAIDCRVGERLWRRYMDGFIEDR